MGRIVKYLPILVPLTFISLSLYAYFYLSPEEVIDAIGVKNAYTLMFVLSFMGGLSTFSGVPYHIVLITLALAGINPIYLGLATSIGVMLGDSTSYYIGYQGGRVATPKIQGFLDHIYSHALQYPRLFPIFCFLYGSLVPFSNDFITISAGAIKYPFWKVMIPLAIGNLIFNITLSYLSIHAYDFIKVIFL